MPAIDEYVTALNATLASGDSTEHSHRHSLKALVESFDSEVTATNEPKQSEAGAPDYDIKLSRRHGTLSIGKIEAKDIGSAALEIIERDSDREKPRTRSGEQLKRYRGAFENLILTDYVEFRWYVRGELRTAKTLGTVSANEVTLGNEASSEVTVLLQNFLDTAPLKIRTPKKLAERMARLAALIREVILSAMGAKSLSQTTTGLHRAFKETLVADLTDEAFADMMSQTIAYGLFAARVQHSDAEVAFTRLTAAQSIPRTNPFLRRLFGVVTGPELEDEPYVSVVDDLAQLLNDADMNQILKNFGAEKRDPIVHFYETFLGAYDPELRDVRGVYYTPLPIVSYIVRSVDKILASSFGLPAGIADTTRTGPGDDQPHKVLVLDPATGTGTFLYEVVDLIRERFMSQGRSGMWPAYVKEHLLPRLHGFELMMAPYAVAHLKLALQLAGKDLPENERAEAAYDFATDERIGIYLTNALDPGEAHSTLPLGQFISDEANAASAVKSQKPIMVVLGNPPYQGQSANASSRRELVGTNRNGVNRFRTVKTAIGELLTAYYQVDGAPIQEQNSKWLQDDYVKFIRLGQSRIDATGYGVLGYVTNHTYLDAPTFRGMRQSLLQTFNDIYILDLHGSIRRRDSNPDGGVDDNVFDQIQQGVCIAIFVKTQGDQSPATIHYSDKWGSREEKYDWLDANTTDTTVWEDSVPVGPFYSFRPEDPVTREEWLDAPSLTEIFPVYSVGIATHRDELAVDTRSTRLKARLEDFCSTTKSDDEVRRQYFGTKGRVTSKGIHYLPGDNADWDLVDRRAKLIADDKRGSSIKPILYRPFDSRYVVYHADVVDRRKYEVMKHMLSDENIGLISARSNKSGVQDQFLVTDLMTETKTGEATTGSVLFPLWLYADDEQDDETLLSAAALSGRRNANIGPQFKVLLKENLGLDPVDKDRGDLTSTIGPRDVLDYVYGVVHSRTYRVRYGNFLRSDYPRIPITSDITRFRLVCEFGANLVDLHMLKAKGLDTGATGGPTRGTNTVDAIPAGQRWVPGEEVTDQGQVVINLDGGQDGGPQLLPGVDEDVWRFEVGGHQVLKKWLDARKGDVLTFSEMEHLVKTVNAIRRTIDLQDEIEELLTGWPLL
ncbi:type ISP restriction/modification enzyme [Nesterenkonia lutea]|uniref:site-specific DNA-methyltransferase (adenine-specific) n=1 Tax=Nesterenkonia lutea TaxID=272919 RepID=A0ABR9JBR6_9MICC|nr:type ISP restriction/modification enzyme [Nesterenkonia lutea]MBE1523230.1 putative helicase [Nesterenkonia lutea]